MYGGVLSPHGVIAHQELGLIVQATWLMLIVVIPVLGLVFFFAWRYRKGAPHSRYAPNWEHSKIDELIWWAIPFEIVLVLGALAWQSTYALDPHKTLASEISPLSIEVVALPGKWLFIYPEQNVALVNEVWIPVNTPVNFSITSDAPMNSFFIPQLGGQIYAMTGMVTPLSLSAEDPGDYRGISANYSGEDFAKMHFVVHARPQADFDTWVLQTQQAPFLLTQESYAHLREEDASSSVWGAVSPGLFDRIVQQFTH